MEHVNEPVLAHLHTHYGAFQQYTAGAVKTETSKKIRQKKTARFFFLIFSTCVAPVLFYK
jgi:hypothetical protein